MLNSRSVIQKWVSLSSSSSIIQPAHHHVNRTVQRTIFNGGSTSSRPSKMMMMTTVNTIKSTPALSLRFRYGKSNHPEPYRPAMLDDMPVPKGKWQEHYNKRNAKYNRHFIIGVSFFLFTVWFITQSGYLFFNFYPPPLPELDEDQCIRPIPKRSKKEDEE